MMSIRNRTCRARSKNTIMKVNFLIPCHDNIREGAVMKKFSKSVLGVTLLEIMLVLAIAAMVIVMSVRYYQSATASQQANSALQLIQGIAAAADGLAQGKGSYSGEVTTASITALMPGGIMKAPWGGVISITGSSASTYSISIASMPAAVCSQVKSRLEGNPKYKNIATCGTSAAAFTYTYDATL